MDYDPTGMDYNPTTFLGLGELVISESTSTSSIVGIVHPRFSRGLHHPEMFGQNVLCTYELEVKHIFCFGFFFLNRGAP